MGISCGWILWLRIINTYLLMLLSLVRARMDSNVPLMGAPLPLCCNLAMGAQQAKLDASIHTASSVIGTSSINQRLEMARLPFSIFMTITTLLLRTGPNRCIQEMFRGFVQTTCDSIDIRYGPK
jgi:hypothetical protein